MLPTRLPGIKTHSGGTTGRSLQSQRPPRASQILVKIRVAWTPPWSATKLLAATTAGSSAGRPTALIAMNTSVVTLTSPSTSGAIP
jgi:hypothetical protein